MVSCDAALSLAGHRGIDGHAYPLKTINEIPQVWHALVLEGGPNKLGPHIDFECLGLEKCGADHLPRHKDAEESKHLVLAESLWQNLVVCKKQHEHGYLHH